MISHGENERNSLVAVVCSVSRKSSGTVVFDLRPEETLGFATTYMVSASTFPL